MTMPGNTSELGQHIGRLIAELMGEIRGDPQVGDVDIIVSYRVPRETPWAVASRSHRITANWDANGLRTHSRSTTERRGTL